MAFVVAEVVYPQEVEERRVVSLLQLRVPFLLDIGGVRMGSGESHTRLLLKDLQHLVLVDVKLDHLEVFVGGLGLVLKGCYNGVCDERKCARRYDLVARVQNEGCLLLQVDVPCSVVKALEPRVSVRSAPQYGREGTKAIYVITYPVEKHAGRKTRPRKAGVLLGLLDDVLERHGLATQHLLQCRIGQRLRVVAELGRDEPLHARSNGGVRDGLLLPQGGGGCYRGYDRILAGKGLGQRFGRREIGLANLDASREGRGRALSRDRGDMETGGKKSLDHRDSNRARGLYSRQCMF